MASTLRRWKRSVTVLLLLASSPLGGCYYGHLAKGQARLLWTRQPVEAVLADAETPGELAERLQLVARVLEFAETLGLAVDGQYQSYAEWPGDRIITVLVTTRPGEVDAAGFWFPVIGTMPYKGFFEFERAERAAAQSAKDGLGTCLLPVRAYSTLGWLSDPLTGPMVRVGAERLVETVLHELVHATVFASADPDFNEGLATFFGQEAAVAFQAQHSPETGAADRVRVEEDRSVSAALQGFREAVAALYEREPEGTGRDAARAELETHTRSALAAMPLTTRDAAALGERVRLTDACQALTGTYHANLPGFAAALVEMGGDLRAFLEAAATASDTDDPPGALFAPSTEALDLPPPPSDS